MSFVDVEVCFGITSVVTQVKLGISENKLIDICRSNGISRWSGKTNIAKEKARKVNEEVSFGDVEATSVGPMVSAGG